MFLFALPAGALADIVDRRKFLIVVEISYTTVAAIFAAIVWLGLATPGNLLLFTFLMGVGAALTAPAWQSIVPQLVPRQDLSPRWLQTASASMSAEPSVRRWAA